MAASRRTRSFSPDESRLKLSCFFSGRAAVIASDVRNQFQIVLPHTRKLAVANQVIAVFVVLLIADHIANILQPSGHLEQFPISLRH